MSEYWHIVGCRPDAVDAVREGDVYAATTLLAALPYAAGTTVCRVRLRNARQGEHPRVVRGDRRELVLAVDAGAAFRDLAETVTLQAATLWPGAGRELFWRADKFAVNAATDYVGHVRMAFRSAVYEDDYGAVRGAIHHARRALEMTGSDGDKLEADWTARLEQEVMR